MTELNKSLDKGIKILKQIAMENGVGLRELSRITGTSLAVTEKFVRTLESHHFVDKDESGKIILGSELIYLGKMVEARTELIQIILYEIRELVKEINETVYLLKREGKHVIFIEGAKSTHPIQYTPQFGKPYELSVAATGRAFMAFMDEEELKEIIEYYKIDSKDIMNKLELVRKQKYAFSYEERFDGLSGIAFPLLTRDNKVPLVLAIGIPTYRYSEEKVKHILERSKITVGNIQEAMEKTFVVSG